MVELNIQVFGSWTVFVYPCHLQGTTVVFKDFAMDGCVSRKQTTQDLLWLIIVARGVGFYYADRSVTPEARRTELLDDVRYNKNHSVALDPRRGAEWARGV